MFSEDIFACARAWHRDAAARAFLAHSESSCTALCAMNTVPVCLTATVEPRGLLALELRARCCPHRRCVLSEADRLCLAQQLRQRSSSISSSSSSGGGGGRGFAAELRERLHEASCRWRRIDAEAAECLVRHRCAALVLSKASSYAFGSSYSSSSSPLPRPLPPPLPPLPPLSSSLSPSPPLQSSDRQSAVSCVLPRGTPPAFVRARLMPPTAEWIAAAAGERGPMCDAPVEVQRALFMRKRPRGTAVDSSLSLSQSLALGSPLALLVALFGFSFRVGGTGAHWAARVGADAACHYCGAAPAVIETPEENHKDGKNCENHKDGEDDENRENHKDSEKGENHEVGENYENREDDEHYENREDDEHYEDHDDHEGDNEEEPHCSGSAAPPVTICIDAHSGHCPNCPWRQLMLAPALRTSSSSTTVLEFDCGAARLRFALPDVVALMSLWRRSEHCEKSIGCGAYVSDAITAAVRAAIPPPPDAAVAAFLQSLRTHCPHHSDADCKDCKDCKDCCVDYEDCYEEDCYEDDAMAVCCRAAALVLAPGGPSADFFAAEASAWRNVLREAAPLAEIHSPVKAAEAQGAFCEMYERTARRPLAESREPSAVEAVAAGVLEALRAAGSAEESRELKGAADPRVAAFLDAMDTAGKSTVRVGVGEAQRSAKPIARSAPHHHHQHHHQQQHHQQQSHQQHYQHQHHQYQQQSQHRHSHHHQHHQEQQHEHQHPRVFQSQSFRSNSVLPTPGANAPSLWEQHQHQHHHHQYQHHHHQHHQHQHHHQHMMKQQAVSVGSPFAAGSSGVLSDAYAQRPLAPADKRNDRGGRFRGRGGRGGGGRPFRGRADK